MRKTILIHYPLILKEKIYKIFALFFDIYKITVEILFHIFILRIPVSVVIGMTENDRGPEVEIVVPGYEYG